MVLKSISGTAAGLALLAAPVVASPAFAAPAATSASKLSVVRAAMPAKGKSNLAGGSGVIAGLAIAAGIVAIAVIAIVNDGNNDNNNSVSR